MELLWEVRDAEIRERALRWEAENRGKRAIDRARRLRLLRRALEDIFARNPDLPPSFLRYLAWCWCLDLRTVETMWECYQERRARLRTYLAAVWLPQEDRILLAHRHHLPYAVLLVNRWNAFRGVTRSLPAARRRVRALERRRNREFFPLIV